MQCRFSVTPQAHFLAGVTAFHIAVNLAVFVSVVAGVFVRASDCAN